MWKNKADEICSYIPDFGGFLVKADSEGYKKPDHDLEYYMELEHIIYVPDLWYN